MDENNSQIPEFEPLSDKDKLMQGLAIAGTALSLIAFFVKVVLL